MQPLSHDEVFALIAKVNSFADDAESLINSVQSTAEHEKQTLQCKYRSLLLEREKSYNANCKATVANSNRVIAEAKRMLADIADLERRLSHIDKYYAKTKGRNEILLEGKTNHCYSDCLDYFSALEQIKKAYDVLYEKYTRDILPALINGLNYMFSSRRKKDYEELIVLKNTVTAFVAEVEEVLPQVTRESLSDLAKEYSVQRDALLVEQRRETDICEQIHAGVSATVADKIWAVLDELLPDDRVSQLADLMQFYTAATQKVNVSNEPLNGMLDMGFVDYSVGYFVQSPIVAALIKDKCKSLLTDGAVRLPVVINVKEPRVLLIENSDSDAGIGRAMSHSIMFSFLALCPTSRLTYNIIDPDNRGNSILPYFDAKKRMPELFGSKIHISQDEILEDINRLNLRIEDTLQNKLGNQYSNIFDYTKNTKSEAENLELLVVYDFPNGFTAQSLSGMRNIIKYGGQCGLFTVLIPSTKTNENDSNEFKQYVESIESMAAVLKLQDSAYTLRGLPFKHCRMPEKSQFSRYFCKYMLICEGIKNKGIAFSPLMRGIMDAKDMGTFETRILEIKHIMKTYDKSYSKVPHIDSPFPSQITLGSISYPADVFSDSPWVDKILKEFCRETESNQETAQFIELPLIFDLSNAVNLFLNCPEQISSRQLAVSHHIILSFLSYIPVTKIKICVCDSERRGNSIIPFLDFRKKVPDAFDQSIYTSQEAVYEKLLKLNAQVDEFIQDKLANRFRNIVEYNKNIQSRAEAITLLMIYDFPSGFDGRSIDLLINILKNGSRCGIYTVICHNPDIAFSKYDNIDERIEQIMRHCMAIDCKSDQYVVLPYNLHYRFPAGISNSQTNAFITDYAKIYEEIKKKGLSFTDILDKELYVRKSATGLHIPIGIGDADSIISIELGSGSSHHGLIAGATGSGKSTLLHTLIISAMLHYSPEQLHLYLMDFKSGTEFKIYESKRLPHIQLLALDAMQEFGESILENLVADMENRGNLFKRVGQSSLKGYTEETGQALPRILVIMDEFQILFNDSTNRKVAMNCAELTKRLVTEGRAFGIHLLMATQSTKVISDLTLSHGTLEQMRIRIGLKCGEDDARYLFSDRNDQKALSMMKGPIGTAVINPEYMEESNIGFRTAYCDGESQERYLAQISQRFSDCGCSTQTFEGGRTTPLLQYFEKMGVCSTDERPVQIHMGELIKVAPPFVVRIDKKRKYNLLVCGANERMADTLTNNYALSALLNRNAFVYCIDGNALVGENASKELYSLLASHSPCFQVADDRGDIIRIINEVYDKYSSRKRNNDNTVDLIIIKNLQFLDIVKSMLKGEAIDGAAYIETNESLQPEDPNDLFGSFSNFISSRSSSDVASATDKLLRLVADGSGYGVHFVISSLEYQTVRECMYYGENVLSKFPERIIFALNNNDADNLIENVSVSGLRDNTVYYTDGVRDTFQLKPFRAPSVHEVDAFLRNALDEVVR